MSGIIISSIFNKTFNYNNRTNLVMEDNESSEKNDNLINEELNNDINAMPPERDVRDTQPTISVNYRIIKNNGSTQIKDRDENTGYSNLQDDWYDDNSDW